MKIFTELKKLLSPVVLVVTLLIINLYYLSTITDFLSTLFDIDTNKLGGIIKYTIEIILWLSIGWLIARSINFWSIILRIYFNVVIPKLLKDIVIFIIFITTIIGILAIVLDFPIGGVLLTSGVSTILIGLLLKNILSDIFSGIALNIELPYKIGDYVELENGVKGKVIDINWRTTTIKPISTNILNIVPNKMVSSMIIKNFNRPYGHYREYIELYLGFSTEPSHAIRILTAAAKSVAIEVEGTRSDVVIMGITEQGIKYRVRYWTPEFLKQHHTRTKLIITVMNHLYQAGITPLYQPSDIFITQMKRKETHNIKDILSRNSFFKVFTDDELHILSSFSNKILKPLNSIIVEENQEKKSLFILIEGLAEATITDANGKEEHIQTIVAGDIFGEFSLLTGERYSVTITSTTDTLLYEIKDENIRPILEKRPDIIKGLSTLLTQRRLSEKCFSEIARKKGEEILKEADLSKKISKDMSELFLSFFSIKD